MEQVNVMVFGRLIAAQAELEAMKLDNEIRKAEGHPLQLNYPPESFFAKAEEIRGIVNELFKY